MEQCSGLTSRGHRCCKKTKDTYKCYGLDVPLCVHHKKSNPIYKWSYVGDYSASHEKIVKWLDFFNDITANNNVQPWMAVHITTRLYDHLPSDVPTYDLMNSFFNSVLLPCDTIDCPVCLSSNEDECVTTPCGHSFCRKCIVQWMYKKIRCPLCRKIIC